jgi:hypothetical protein
MLQNGRWSRENVQRGTELLHRDGLLAIAGIVELDHLSAIRTEMLKASKEIITSKKDLSDFVRRRLLLPKGIEF